MKLPKAVYQVSDNYSVNRSVSQNQTPLCGNMKPDEFLIAKQKTFEQEFNRYAANKMGIADNTQFMSRVVQINMKPYQYKDDYVYGNSYTCFGVKTDSIYNYGVNAYYPIYQAQELKLYADKNGVNYLEVETYGDYLAKSKVNGINDRKQIAGNLFDVETVGDKLKLTPKDTAGNIAAFHDKGVYQTYSINPNTCELTVTPATSTPQPNIERN